MKFSNGFENIKVTLIDWPGTEFAEKVYKFGQLSHDYYQGLPSEYDENDPDCIKLIDKIIAGKTLPKFSMQGLRFNFKIENISRICLAQLTRDSAIFASASTGVFPLTQDFIMPMSIYKDDAIMDKVKKAQKLLEEAYIMAIEKEIPTIEARYIGLHCQTISLTASYTAADFARSCHSRTSSNFCDECNYVYRLMYSELVKNINSISDTNSIKLYKWLFNEAKCINDGFYERERLFNSDFTASNYVPELPALNDWRKSGWKLELERMYNNYSGYLTDYERAKIHEWLKIPLDELPTTYDNSQPDVAVNLIKEMDYYER